jgi:hypothetical protein
MTSVASRTLRESQSQKSDLTIGALVAAFYDEALRMSKSSEEADRLAKMSLAHCLRRHVRRRTA